MDKSSLLCFLKTKNVMRTVNDIMCRARHNSSYREDIVDVTY